MHICAVEAAMLVLRISASDTTNVLLTTTCKEQLATAPASSQEASEHSVCRPAQDTRVCGGDAA